MKKIFIFICALWAVSAAQAQCPQYLVFDTAICGSSVNRTVDASILASRLCGDTFQVIFNDSTTSLNGSAQVYFHSGPEFRPLTGWQGQYTVDTGNSTAGLMTKIGTHLWSIKFNPRTYYGYSADSCLNAIAFGFRDATYANYIKCGTNDLYVVTATGVGVSTSSCTFFTATYTHSTNITYTWSDGNHNAVRTFTTGGNFTVTATGIGGCTATGSARIRLGNSKVSIGNDTIECTTSSYVFVATPGFSSYQWLDAAASTSNTHQAINPTGGTYWVKATDSLGCVSYDTATVHLSETGYLTLPATLSSCPGNPVSADASTNITANGDSITITYNASLGQSTLAGDTNVYLYSAPQFYSFAPWPANDPYTVGNFTANDGLGRMKSLGNNLWSITIDPQSYYHYSPDTPLNGIWMIFRNFNGTKTGRDTTGGDIFVYTVPTVPTSTSDAVVASRKARLPLSYSWSNGVHTAADTFTSGGTYHVTVSDGVCSHTDSVVVTFTASGTISLGADTTVCAGQHVVITAGAGYSHYHWSNGDTTQTTNVVIAATYSVTVTTANGCQSTGSRKVKNSVHQVSLGADITRCSTTATTIAATSGFLSYSWIGKAAVTTSTYPAVNAGCYWVAAKDSAGCFSYDTVRVINSPVLGLNVVDSITSCPGNSVAVDASTSIVQHGDSVIIIYDATKHSMVDSLVGATKVYMHSGPEFYPYQGWQTQYTVGNFGQDDGVGQMTSLGNNKWRIAIVPQCYYGYSPDTPLNGIWMVFRNADGSHTGKNYTNTDIFVNTSTTPPTSAFDGVTASRAAASGTTYSWLTPAGVVLGSSVNVTTTGLYIVTASAGVCSKSDTIHASFNSNSIIHLGADTTICFGDSARLDAGAGYTHYTWSNGDTTEVIKVGAAITYSVTATNNTGCSATGQRALHISHPSVSLGTDRVECTTAPFTLTAPAGFASYRWINRAPSSATFSGSKTGTYWLAATDSFGCTASDTISVRYSEVLQVSLQDSITSCPGNQVPLDAGSNIQVHGDSITIIYDATKGQTGLVNASKVYMYSGPEFHPFQGWQTQYTAGHFNLDDGIGKMDSLGNNKWSITIFPQSYYGYSPDSPLNGIFIDFRNANGTQTGKDDNGNDIFLNLSGITPTSSFEGITAIHKEAGTLTYAWSNGQIAPSIVVDTTGLYVVTVSDGSCSHSDSTFVNLSSNLTIHIGNDTAICPSGHVTFDAGAGFTSYRWSTGDTTRTITRSAAGSYAVTVSAASGCVASDTAVITVAGAKVNAGADVVRCGTQPVTLTASSGFTAYHWFGVAASSATYAAVNDGCYWLEAVDAGGCTSFDTVCVSTSSVGNLHLHDTVSVCSGATTTFDASAEVNAKGDSLVITFDATQNSTSAALLGANKIYMHSAPQFHAGVAWGNNPYTVGNFGQDDGVGEMDSVGPNKWQITIFPSCYYHFNPDTPLYGIWMVFRNANGSIQNGGGDINLQLSGVATPTTTYAGVTASYKAVRNVVYSWSTGAATGAATFSTPGTFTVTATDGVCSQSDSLTVLQKVGPTVSLGDDTCLGSNSHTVVLGPTATFASYLWSTGASSQTITANHTGTYWIRVSNGTGCFGSDTVKIDSTCGSVPIDTTHLGSCTNIPYFRVLNVSAANTVTIKDSSINSHIYYWNFGDGTFDTTAGNQVHTYAQAGIYVVTLIVRSSDTCVADTLRMSVNVNSTGIAEIAGLSDVSLYPSPASNSCAISMSVAENMEVAIEINNILGATVQAGKWQLRAGSNKFMLDLSGITSGMYTVAIRSASGLVTKKLDIIK